MKSFGLFLCFLFQTIQFVQRQIKSKSTLKSNNIIVTIISDPALRLCHAIYFKK